MSTIENFLFLNLAATLTELKFQQILEKYVQIEKQIIFDITQICSYSLEGSGVKRQSDKLVLHNGNVVLIEPHFDHLSRCLLINFEIYGCKKLKPICKRYLGFGNIKETKYIFPEQLARLVPDISEKVGQYLKLTYDQLEDIYLQKFSQWNLERKDVLLHGIIDLLNAGIRVSNNERFKNKVWLSVIEIDKKDPKIGVFVFEFNEHFLKEFISRLKKDGRLRFSPFILITDLITKSVIDEQTDRYIEKQYVFQVALNTLNIRLDDATHTFWLASNSLYKEKNLAAMGCYTVAHHDEYLLSIDHSAYNQDFVKSIVTPIEDRLVEKFKENVQNYKMSSLSKLTFRTSAVLQDLVISYEAKFKDVIGGKLIEDALYGTLKNLVFEGLKLI